MLYGNNRSEIRAHYHEAYRKFKAGEVLTPLENQLIEIINLHPEYHYLFNDPEANLYQDFSADEGQSNPYLHMAMHAAIRDQIQLNQPQGIREIYQKLLQKIVDPHEVEHLMMDVLVEEIWQTMRNNKNFDGNVYLEKLKNL